MAAGLAHESTRVSVRLLGADHPIALGHFPGNPIVPGAVVLDAVLRAAEACFALPPSAWELPAAKFLTPVRPGDEVRISLTRHAGSEVKFECFVGERAVASGTLKPLADADAACR
jgi:3-hydroxyacyl-[acyl-carrier-protein] dehydratase